jgi:DNA polymerase IV (DinB-like DNA polymerase)
MAEKLTCSIGLGQNKLIAKIASDFRKPDGLTTIRPDETINFLAPSPVERLPGVGSKTTKRLGELGVTTIDELSRLELVALEESFGHKFGIYLYKASRGVDEEPVVERAESSQISRIITLKANSSNSNEIFSQLLPAVEDASKRMLEKKVSYRTLSVIGIYTDLSIKTKSKTFELPANDSVTLKRHARELLEELVGSSKMEMRRTGVRLSELSSNAEQHSLTDYAGDQRGDADG